jgi:dolichol-phosphate mannosyltransferase
VDDNSRDGSEEAVHNMAKTAPCRIIVRTQERGLSSAVLRGFKEAKGNILLCMDADLQHPPEHVPDMVRALNDTKAEFAIGTRYANKELSIDKDWPLYRRIISAGARMLALPLSPLSDPMTGFFAMPKDVFKRGEHKINPIGFKIALECFVKCDVNSRKVAQVPIQFGVRLHGESKLSSKVIIGYLKHLQELYLYKFPGLVFFFFLLLVLALFFFFNGVLRK